MPRPRGTGVSRFNPIPLLNPKYDHSLVFKLTHNCISCRLQHDNHELRATSNCFARCEHWYCLEKRNSVLGLSPYVSSGQAIKLGWLRFLNGSNAINTLTMNPVSYSLLSL